jgi:FtsP/CotA-like multicopper oxidase with cupredoxin domain/plastocyanin
MADVEYWIQLENRAWDLAPNNIDRMTGQTMAQVPGGAAPVVKTLSSPETGVVQTRTMFKPLGEDALILRRYTAGWAAPDDRKVNPWDLNERNPTDTGTMGTIPGPVIECNVGDRVIVHFRNKDSRAGKNAKQRAHSLHPHGFVFDSRYDGAYPLSPADPTQPVGGEAALWAQVGVSGSKQGDRIPPNGTFDYFWNTFSWPTTAGVWLYHDHSFCDVDNVMLGAIGIIVIHNSADPDDVINQDLPGGHPNGAITRFRCFPFPLEEIRPLPIELERLGDPLLDPRELIDRGHAAMREMEGMEGMEPRGEGEDDEPQPPKRRRKPPDVDAPVVERSFRRGDLIFELDPQLELIKRFCMRFYVDPPDSAQYLQLYHEMTGVGMLINGRKYLGNTPTVVAGLNTKMRFGLVGMNLLHFHTFHLHGHRWTIPGPDGNNPGTIQGSPQVTAVSQFEDTRTFGPANSFSFTVNQGSFMGALRAPDASALGEWHMHCHVLGHMHDGMMGSMLVVEPGQLAGALPRGEPCHDEDGGGDGPPAGVVVQVTNNAFTPQTISVAPNTTVTWQWMPGAQFHSTTSDTPRWDSGIQSAPFTFAHTFTAADAMQSFPYHCVAHGGAGGLGMAGTVTVTM